MPTVGIRSLDLCTTLCTIIDPSWEFIPAWTGSRSAHPRDDNSMLQRPHQGLRRRLTEATSAHGPGGTLLGALTPGPQRRRLHVRAGTPYPPVNCMAWCTPHQGVDERKAKPRNSASGLEKQRTNDPRRGPRRLHHWSSYPHGRGRPAHTHATIACCSAQIRKGGQRRRLAEATSAHGGTLLGALTPGPQRRRLHVRAGRPYPPVNCMAWCTPQQGVDERKAKPQNSASELEEQRTNNPQAGVPGGCSIGVHTRMDGVAQRTPTRQ